MVTRGPDAKRILVVEDEQDVAALLRARLESVGYEVHVEGEGRKAVQLAEKLRPHLVILDLMLPDTDGYAVSEHLRRRFHSCMVPILMLTARSDALDKLEGFGSGADAYMTKPYDARDLLRTIEKLLHDAGLD
jgi:two-component system, OmpR family, response regulator